MALRGGSFGLRLERLAMVFYSYGKPDLENCPHLRQARLLSWKCLRFISVLWAILALALASGSSASTDLPPKQDVLILNEAGF
jgi:hypothetical protein